VSQSINVIVLNVNNDDRFIFSSSERFSKLTKGLLHKFAVYK